MTSRNGFKCSMGFSRKNTTVLLPTPSRIAHTTEDLLVVDPTPNTTVSIMALQWLDGSVEFQQKHEREHILPKNLKEVVFSRKTCQKSGGKQIFSHFRALGQGFVWIDLVGSRRKPKA